MKSKLFPILVSTFVIVMLAIFPDRYILTSLEGLKIFALNVLPSLLPFLFFAQLLTNIGVGEKMGRFLKKPCAFLYNTGGIGGYVFAMSVMSGYPIGAKLVSECIKSGSISRQEGKSILSYSSTSGPMFVLGTVGCLMLKNQLSGAVILICHYLSALLNGLLFRNHKRAESIPLITTSNNAWGESARNAVNSALICGVYIAVFYMVAIMLKDVGVITVISSLFRPLLGEVSDGLVFGLIEMTGGCIALSQTHSPFTLPAICAVISFGGLSVALQSITFLGECGIKSINYVVSKITQSVIAFFITFIVCTIFSL